MNQYVTGEMIRRLRESRKLTQHQLAEKLSVSDKTVSKWETGRGYPDISLIEPLSAALGVSVIELFAGENVVNTNRAGQMLRSRLHVCPVCGNVILSAGEAVISCCGIVLPALEAEETDEAHRLHVEKVEDEYYVTIPHEMSKTHYISFILAARDDGGELRKLYPEGEAEARFKIGGTKCFYYYCNRHGLFRVTLPTPEQLRRITAHEAMLREAEALLRTGGDETRLRELIDKLEAYYTSSAWKRDFAADEAGLLPPELPRGVLSEDGIDALLEAYKEK